MRQPRRRPGSLLVLALAAAAGGAQGGEHNADAFLGRLLRDARRVNRTTEDGSGRHRGNSVQTAGEHESLERPVNMKRGGSEDSDLSDSSSSLSLRDRFSPVARGDRGEPSPFVTQEKLNRLWEYLFSAYYKEVPPVPVDGGPLFVGVGINFVKFMDFDELQGSISLALNLRLCWADDRLAFDAEEFFGRRWTHEGDKLPVRSDRIWTPDVTVLNEMGSTRRAFREDFSPLVLSDNSFRNETGVNLLWSRPMHVNSKCTVDMSLYPFDVQRCSIIIGSWAASRRQMQLVLQPFFAEHTVHTSEFRVRNITASQREVHTRGTAQTFTEVVYTLVLQRYPHYYVVNFILPMVAITLLTVSTMWMGASNIGPRVNSSTKLLLCVVSIMFITARKRPAIHGDIWLDRFQSHCLALSMAAVLESFLVDYISKRTSHVSWVPRSDVVDVALRTFICVITTITIFADAWEVQTDANAERRGATSSGVLPCAPLVPPG